MDQQTGFIPVTNTGDRLGHHNARSGGGVGGFSIGAGFGIGVGAISHRRPVHGSIVVGEALGAGEVETPVSNAPVRSPTT